VYSSAFQTLKVFSVSSSSTTVPGEYEGPNKITITHNLGYLSPFIVVYNGSSSIGTTKSYVSGPSICPAYFDVVDQYLTVRQYTDKLEIYIYNGFDIAGGTAEDDTVYFTVYVFLNDFTAISGTNINTGTTSGSSSTDYGIRISKPGYDVKTTDDINCVLSSSFFNQIIHQVGIDTSGYDTINISHNLGYIPSYLCFTKESSSDTYIRLFTITKTTTTKLVIDNVYSYDEFYYIIFKQKNG
jgi:hypothetical protein